MPIEVILTERIRDAIDEVFGLDSTADGLKNELKSWQRSGVNFNEQATDGHSTHVKEVINRNDANIPFDTVKKVFETLNKAGKVVYLNELMEGSGLYFEAVQEPKKVFRTITIMTIAVIRSANLINIITIISITLLVIQPII